jgi:hypothetical protein
MAIDRRVLRPLRRRLSYATVQGPNMALTTGVRASLYSPRLYERATSRSTRIHRMTSVNRCTFAAILL